MVPVGERYACRVQDKRRTTAVAIDANRAAGLVKLSWADGHETTYDAVTLRWLCPCASAAARPACRLAGHEAVADGGADADGRPVAGGQLRGPADVGDGHHTGYHTFMLLREQCPCDACARERDHRHDALENWTAPAGRRPPLAWRGSMIIATAPYIAGYRVHETKGQVFGLVVRSRGLGGNLVAGLRSIVGGEIHEYTSLLEDTRRQAIDRMVQNATHGRRERDHLVPLRLVGAGRDDVRDRRLRHGRRDRSEFGDAPTTPPPAPGVPRR